MNMKTRRWLAGLLMLAMFGSSANATTEVINEVVPIEANPESFVEFYNDEEAPSMAMSGPQAAPALRAASPKYSLKVDTVNQVVSAYDSSGRLIRQMICSTGKTETPTPAGTFSISSQYRWGEFTKYDCWAQYWSRFNGPILFHSVLYRKQDESTLITSSVDNLGSKASHGCVRLRVPDAKWIYDNCKSGTKVTVFAGKKDARLTAAVKRAGCLEGDNLYAPSAPEPSIGTARIKTSGGTVNFRDKASTSSAVLGAIPNGTTVEVVRIETDWVRINYAGTAGYVSRPYIDLGNMGGQPTTPPVTPTQPPTNETVTARGIIRSSGGGVNMRADASTSSSVLRVLPNGTSLDIIRVDGQWVRVVTQGLYGYVSAQYVSILGGSTPVNPPTNNETVIAQGRVSTSGGSLNLRASASSGGTILGSLANGTSLEILGYQGDWARVRFGSRVGYVSLSFLAVTSGQRP